MNESYNDCVFDCQNCNIINPDDYGDCEMAMGVAWTGNTCEVISGCGMGDDAPWFYDNHQVCMTRCSYGYNPGCTNETACNYDSIATEDDDSCEYPEDFEWCDCDGNIDDCSGICGGDDVSCLSIEELIIPDNYSISNIYPNPFNPVTNITYRLPEHVNVQIIVYDLSGKLIKTLINEFQTPGYHSVNWDADNLPSGVYLIRMDSGDFTQTQKVVLVK